jgi:hypothetical protein
LKSSRSVEHRRPLVSGRVVSQGAMGLARR